MFEDEEEEEYKDEVKPLHPYYDIITSKLHQAFEELGYMGFLARSNFSCCSNCGGYELTCIAVDLIKAGKRTIEPGPDQIKGCVFWHAQNEDCLRRTGTVYLAYGDMDSEEFGKIGWETGKCGIAIMEVLEKHRLIMRWNGKPETKIQIVGYKHTIVPGIVEDRLSKDAKLHRV